MTSAILESPAVFWVAYMALVALIAFFALRRKPESESAPPSDPSLDSPWWVRCVLILFLLKVLLLGWVQIPMWDIPDETGHYSYVADIAEGRGFPVVGQAQISRFPNDGLSPMAIAGGNWIAQHPPLYAIILSPVHALTGLLGVNGELRFHLIRAASSLFGVAALGSLYLLLRELQAGRFPGAVICGITASVPMITNMAAGISHDLFLTFLVIMATWAWIRFRRTDHIPFFWLACGFFSGAVITKYTAIPIAALWFFCVACFYRTGWIRWFRDMAIGGAILSAPLGIWMFRNWSISGKLMPVADELGNAPALTISYFDFLRDFSVWETLFQSSICLLGWLGSDEYVDWLFLPAPFHFPWSMALLLLAALGLVQLMAGQRTHRLTLTLAVAITSLLTLPILSAQFTSTNWTFQYAVFLFALVIGLQASANIVIKAPSPMARAASVSHFLMVSFALLVTWQMYERTLESGFLRAAHGRYFFPMIGFAAVGFVGPVIPILNRRPGFLLGGLLIAQGMEISLWLFYAPAYYLIH